MGMFSKFQKDSKLKKALRKVTEATSLDVDKELLCTIVDACDVADSRQEMMCHLQECMSEVRAKKWRRIWGALHIMEAALHDGDSELIHEMAFGLHFDVVWKATLLARFEYAEDKEAEGRIREKASLLRCELIERQQAIQNGDDVCVRAAVFGRARNLWAEASPEEMVGETEKYHDGDSKRSSPREGVAPSVSPDVSVAAIVVGNLWAEAPTEEEGGKTEKEQGGVSKRSSSTRNGEAPSASMAVSVAATMIDQASDEEKSEKSKEERATDGKWTAAESTIAPTLLGRGAAGGVAANVVGQASDLWADPSSPKLLRPFVLG